MQTRYEPTSAQGVLLGVVAKVGICMMEKANDLPRLSVRNDVPVVRFRELWDLKEEHLDRSRLCN